MPARATPRRTARRTGAAASPGATTASAAGARFATIAEAFAGDPRVTAGKMMAVVGLKVNGRIFAMDHGRQLVAKLPRQRVDALVVAGHGVRFDPRHDGRVMKEWVVIGDRGPDWLEIAREAHRFVAALPGDDPADA